MEEKTFYESGDVKVTSARFVVSGDTYPITNISSVKSRYEPPRRGWAVLLIILGLLFSMSALGMHGIDGSIIGAWALALGLLVTGINAYRNQQPQHIVVLTTAGNDVKALKSADKPTIDHVIKALNDSVIHRG